MAYSLIAWHHPSASEDEVAEMQGALDQFTTPLAPSLQLNTEDGWGTLMQSVWSVVQQYPGMQAMVIVPPRGSPVGGWVADAPPETLATASNVMNENGDLNGQYPMMFPLPGQMDEIPYDWRDGIQWPREDDE